VIGWMGDLQRLRRSDLLHHYQTYYTPSNAVLVVAGDVQPPKVFSQAVKYFGAIKSHPVPPWHPVEPPQQGERRFVIRKDVSTPAMMLGYHVPGSNSPDFYAFELLEGLLMRGMTSRMYSRLVYRDGKALSVWGGNDAEGDEGFFYFFAIPRTAGLQDTVEQMIYAELESLKTAPVRDSELTRVKNQIISDFTYRQDDARGVGSAIGQSMTMHGSLDYLNQYPDKVSAVTKDDIMRVAAKYFVEDNRTVGRMVPTGDAPSGPKMMGRGER
jgi:zinc protease